VDKTAFSVKAQDATTAQERPHPPRQPAETRIAGIILAAGESRRMGRDKALLPLGRQTFLEHLIKLLRLEVQPLLVIVGHHAETIESESAGVLEPDRGMLHDPDLPDVVFLRNPDYRLGQLSSLKAGLRHLMNRPLDAALVALVDHPAISKDVVRLLLHTFAATGAPILIPAYQGRRGHPVLFARSVFQELLDAPVEAGARYVVRNHADALVVVETGDEAILWDIDLPQDYERLVGRWNPKRSGFE
jgi:molybdenum cofactor cytidylyltransferase